ncbi:hypothetical protein ACF1BE_34510 [Streptomyces sp. NPDC014991]|uniref:hypothetical protein n=1 Tax=Streptomyces sp. NPDC014991 TaxID=3364935 RepID=UPI0036F53286
MRVGRVVHAAVREDAPAAGRPDVALLRPLSRPGGDEWGTLGEVHEPARMPYREADPDRPVPDIRSSRTGRARCREDGDYHPVS